MAKIIRILFILFLGQNMILAQEFGGKENYDKKNFKPYKTWAVGGKLRSDGFGINVDITSGKKYRSSLLYQFEFGYYKHQAQKRQQSAVYTNSGNIDFKSYFFGKQNNLFALHLNLGQKILLVEKAKKNGMQLFYYYAGGLSLGILKPYMLEVIDPESIFIEDGTPYFSKTKYVDYNPDETYFLGYIDSGSSRFLAIVGGAGFGKGWNLKVRAGLHLKTGLSFDWSKSEGIIKALDLGFSCDIYFEKVPIMLTNNKSVFPSAYLGFQIGKRYK